MKKQILSLCVALLPALVFGQNAPTARPDIDELLLVMRTPQMMEQAMGQMKSAMANAARQAGGPAGSAEKVQAMQAKMFAMVESEMSWDKLKGDFNRIYAESFSPEEVKEILAFYKSPAGQSFLEKQPAIMQKTMAISQQKIMAIMPKVQAMVKEEAQAKALSSETKQAPK